MFDHVVQHLDMETAGRLMDIIENPGSNPYQAIKQAILRSHTPTDCERASAILDWPGLGGCRPSQCLKDMIQVMPTGVTDLGILFKEVFLRQLGKEVRALLAPSANNNASTVVALRALALEADQYYELSGARVNGIVEETEAMIFSPSAPTDTYNAEATDFGIFAISGRGGYTPRGRGNFGFRGRGGRQGSRPSSTFCYYHARYGSQAKQCTPPCDFQKINQSRDSQTPNGRGRGNPGNFQSGRW